MFVRITHRQRAAVRIFCLQCQSDVVPNAINVVSLVVLKDTILFQYFWASIWPLVEWKYQFVAKTMN